MWFYYLIFFLITATYFLTIDYPFKKAAFYLLSGLLVLIAGLRRLGIDADMVTYIEYYRLVPNISFVHVEPTFHAISIIVKNTVHNVTYLFLVYSILGVVLKIYAIQKLTDFLLLSLLSYFSYYFLLHEMTQIRVGVASAMLLLSIPDIYDRKPKQFAIKLVIGCLFHYSLIIFSFFYFLNPKKINPYFHLCLIISAYLLHFSGLQLINLLKLLPVPFIASKIATYELLLSLDIHSAINIFNPLFIFRAFLCLVFIFKWDVLYEQNQYSIILLKIYSVSNFVFVAFSDLPVFAGRANQLLAIVEIILFPFLIYLLRQKTFAMVCVILVGLVMMSIKLFYVGLMGSYFKF